MIDVGLLSALVIKNSFFTHSSLKNMAFTLNQIGFSPKQPYKSWHILKTNQPTNQLNKQTNKQTKLCR